MKIYLSRYSWIWMPIFGLMVLGCLLASFFIGEVSLFQKMTACIVNILATAIYGKRILWERRNFLMTARIESDCIFSKLLWKEYCVIYCDRPVYLFFFRELVELGPPELPYIAISNSPITFAPSQSKILSFDRKKVVLFPDTEKTRQAIAPLMDSEFCVLQGDGPPPVEELRKKKEKKVEPPAVKREKSPDDPPPFNGRWNGRF